MYYINDLRFHPLESLGKNRKIKNKACFKKKFMKADEMAQWIKVLAAKLDYLSSISGTHVVGGEN